MFANVKTYLLPSTPFVERDKPSCTTSKRTIFGGAVDLCPIPTVGLIPSLGRDEAFGEFCTGGISGAHSLPIAVPVDGEFSARD